MAGKSLIFRFADVEVREREFSLVKAGEALAVEPIMVEVRDRLVHDRCYAMDTSKLKAHGWKPQIAPADAIAAAAIELKSAWDNGQILTRRANF